MLEAQALDERIFEPQNRLRQAPPQTEKALMLHGEPLASTKFGGAFMSHWATP